MYHDKNNLAIKGAGMSRSCLTGTHHRSLYRRFSANIHDSFRPRRAASYLKDNHLLPTGFNKTTAPPDVGVYGDALSAANFTGGSDRGTYQISLSGKGPYTITALLLYQTVSYQFAKTFVGGDALVKNFLGYYQAADKTPSLVSSVSKTMG